MAVDRSYVARNTTERERLRALVGRLRDADLSRPLPAGWTIASVLGHLALWDQRAALMLERWHRDGVAPEPIDESSVDWINDASKPLLLALPPRQAADLAVAIAERADRAAETLPDDLVAKNAAAGTLVSLARSDHRHEHLDEIERALAH
jgi:hypothetical protein